MASRKQRFPGRLAILFCASAVLAPAPVERNDFAAGQVIIGGRARTARPDGSGKSVPMVNVDDELANYLTKAERLIKEKSYAEAIEILQAMMRRKELGFIPTEDGQRFVSLRVKAVELIGKMDAEGLKKYRATADPQAQKLYEDAVAKLDTGLMREVVERYLHTTYGPKAMETLAEIDFDRGRFSQAAYCWRQLRQVQKGTEFEPVLLAKLAAALHLAGESDAADEVAKDLQNRFAQVKADLGGREQSLVQFVQRVRSMKSGFATVRRAPQRGWPGLGALPGNFGTMSESDVVLLPRWRQPENDLTVNDIWSSLIAKGSLASGPMQPGMQLTAKLRGGHVLVKGSNNPNSAYEGGYVYPGRPGQKEFNLPALIHPVVVGETTIFRTDKEVVACDLITGQVIWRAFGLAIDRKVDIPNLGQYFGGYYGAMGGICDNGRYALTVAEGKVFALCGFLPPIANLQYVLQRFPNLSKELGDTSSLAAISTDAEGMLLWRIGEGRGDDDVVKGCKFLSVPAYHAGRLYVLAMFTENYYLLCLNADTGAVIWRTSVAQTPVVQRGYYPGAASFLEMGSIPAVADGRVFVLTNAGVIAAYEADSGQPVWAYQYDSSWSSGGVYYPGRYPGRQGLTRPANPVIAAAGRVVCLPSDSASAVGLSAEDGRCLWKADRKDLDDLTGIDDDRVLLSGERLLVLSTSDGKPLPRKGEGESAGEDLLGQTEGIVGRPAVTPASVLACGQGKMYRLDLKTYRVTSVGPAATDALLGNLVSVDGKLIAANTAGLCAYFSYDTARDKLTDRIAKATPAERAALLYQRAHLAFSARRFPQALEDFQACAKLAEDSADSALASQVRPRLYRTYVALGNQASKSEEMLDMFQKAQAYVETNQEKAHMMLRMAKYYRKTGDLPAAASIAQDIGEQFPTEELTDVRIGSDAEEAVRTDAGSRTVRGKQLAESFLREMIEVHGRDCYVKFDALAAEALKKARAAGDPEPMLAVADRWSNSSSAEPARFAAAEVYYTRAMSDKDKADEYYGLAIWNLTEVAKTSSPLRVSATVALAVIFARGNHTVVAQITCDPVRDLPPDTPVEFADIKGKLGDLLDSIQRGKVPVGSMKVRFTQTIATPLREQFKLEGDTIYVLRDQEFRPIRIGEGIFALQGNRAVLVDTASSSAADACQRWVGLTSIDADQMKQNPYLPPGMRLLAGLSQDGKILAVADRTVVTGFEVESAKRTWHKTFGDLGVGQFYCMGVGEGALVVFDTVGNLTCVDLTKGEVRWRAVLRANQPNAARQPVGPPTIAGGVVLVRHNGFRTITCFNLETGKIVEKFEAQSTVEAMATKDGMLALLVDGALSVREIAQIGKPFWTRKYETNLLPTILAFENERIAVSRSQASGEIDVLSVVSGNELAKLSVAKVESASVVPVEGCFSGGNLYVTCSMANVGRRRSAYGQMSNSRGLVVQKFDLSKKTADPAWTAAIETNMNLGYLVMPLTIGQKHVALTAKSSQVGTPYYAYVLDAETGDVKEKLDLLGQGGQVKDAQRRGALGPPVMTNGHLLVETTEGVTVYGGR